MNTKTLVLTILILLVPTLAFADQYTYTSQAGVLTSWTTNAQGQKFTITNTTQASVSGIYKMSGSTVTHCYLYTSSCTLIAIGTSYTNNYCAFNTTGIFSNGESFYILSDKNGNTFDGGYSAENTTSPASGSFSYFNVSASGAACGIGDSRFRVLNAINLTVSTSQNLTIRIQDDVTGGYINGFCVDLTVGSSTGQNTSESCTQEPALAYPKTPSSLCGSTKNCSIILEDMNNQSWNQIVDNDFATNGGLAAERWYTTEGTCTGTLCQDQLHNGDGSCTTRSIAGNQFCQVTDQLGILLINFAMGQNQTRYEQLHNMTELLRHPSAGNLQCWKSYINGNGVYNDYTDVCVSDDSASDASLAILKAYGIACAKQRAGVWVNGSRNYCSDYAYQADLIWQYEIVKLPNNKYFLCNGHDNAATGCPTVTQSYRPDYYLLDALWDNAEYTQNTTRMTGVLDMLEAVNKSLGTNNIPYGKTGFFNANATTYTCGEDQDGTYPCVGSRSYMDNIDNWRWFMWMGRTINLHSDRVNGTLNTTIFANLTTRYSGGNASISATGSKPFEIYANTVNGGVRSTEDSYKTFAMHMALMARMNATYANTMMDDFITNHWQNTKFSGAAYMAGYYTQYAVATLGDITGMYDPNYWTGGLSVCVQNSTATYTQQGFRITLNSPLNESTQSSSTAILNVTVYNLNASTNTTTTTQNASRALYNSTFSTNPTADGWVLGSATWNSSLGILRLNTSNGANVYSQNLSLSQYPLGFLIELNMSYGNSTNTKICYAAVSQSSTSNSPCINMERNTNNLGVNYSWKHDYESFPSVQVPVRSYQNLSILVNRTANTTRICAGTYGCAISNIPGSDARGDYFAIIPGQNMQTSDCVGLCGLNVSNINITNLNAGTFQINTTTTNANMTVSFLNASLTTLSSTSNVQNATTLNHTLTGLSNGTTTWSVRIASVNGNQTFGPFQFSVNTAVGTSTTLCTLGESVTYNTTGTYNISAYSIGFGDGGEGLYYNTSTQNYAYTQPVNLILTTFQGWINLTATRLFLNTSITTFNATNTNVTNTTSTGSTMIKASNGPQTVTIGVPGNYSRAYTITGIALQTIQYNATDIYDNNYTFTATAQDGTITNFTVNASQTTFGTNIRSSTTTTGTAHLGLVQGYTYNITISAPGYSSTSVLLNTNASTHTYNFDLYKSNTLNITYYDEITHQIINTTTITSSFISDIYAINKTTTTGGIQVTLYAPSNYSIRSSASGYYSRNYQFNLVEGTFAYLNLSLLDTGNGTIVTITVKDTLDTPIENAIVKINKYDITTNTYPTVEIRSTNFEGKTQASMVLNDPEYTFTIERNGRVLLMTTPSQIYGTTLTLIVDTTQNTGFEQIFTKYGLSGNVTHQRATQNVQYQYNDASNTLTNACLTIYSLTETRTQHAKTCSAATSGTITIALPEQNGTSYQAIGTITTPNNHTYTLDTIWITFNETIPEDGMGLFMLFLMLILFVLAFAAAGPEIAVITGSIMPALFTFMGLIKLDYTITIPLAIGGVILAFVLGMVRR